MLCPTPRHSPFRTFDCNKSGIDEERQKDQILMVSKYVRASGSCGRPVEGRKRCDDRKTLFFQYIPARLRWGQTIREKHDESVALFNMWYVRIQFWDPCRDFKSVIVSVVGVELSSKRRMAVGKHHLVSGHCFADLKRLIFLISPTNSDEWN